MSSSEHRAMAVVGVIVAAWALTIGAVPRPVRADASGPLTDLVDAAAQRLRVAEPVAAFKWQHAVAIEDAARVHRELAVLNADAVAAGIDPDYVSTVFTDQVDATEAVEYSRFAQWKLDPGSVPAAPPDLSASRATIDGLNHVLLTQIGLRRGLLRSPACAGELGNARRAVTEARDLDALYRQALSFATRSYCRSGVG